MTPTSFGIDHTKLTPGLYYHECYTIGNVKLNVYDLRFKKPNLFFNGKIKGAAVHTIEHLLATELRNYEALASINSSFVTLELSPMGCRTGFYWITTLEREDAIKVMREAVKRASKYTSIPCANKYQCGSFKYHSLSTARKELTSYYNIIENTPCLDNPMS